MRNIIITGGELFNKGAQAMTFIAVQELKKRFPDHEIYLLSEMDLERPEEERRQYAFRFLGWAPLKFASCQHNPLLRALCLLRSRQELLETEKVYRNTDLMIDISGYGLGSIWSEQTCSRYLDHLEFAREFEIPVYLMPQSFGPFDFGADRAAIDDRIRALLPTVRQIFVREKEGYDALVGTYGLQNVTMAGDLVLNSRDFDPDAVFETAPVLHVPPIAPDSVGVIPNSRNGEVGDRDAMIDLYDRMIRDLLESGKHVYLLSHSTVDAKLCASIKSRFPAEDRVVYLEQDFSCLEFNELVRNFRFLIASRFHSIVHAYKNGVPCITLGWATKYRDLLTMFGQERYLFDIRRNPQIPDILAQIHYLDIHADEESRKICSRLESVRKENVFDFLTLK